METLIHQIIDSLQVRLSPEAQQQMQQAQAGLEDVSLVREFPSVDIQAFKENKKDRAAD